MMTAVRRAGSTDRELILDLATVGPRLLPVVGGKTANLGELIRAGFPVPEGFCVTTAAYALLSESAGLEAWLPALATSRAEDATWRTELAAAVRTALLQAPVPVSVA